MAAQTNGADGRAHVIVIGGGFAGVACAHRLAGRRGVRVTLLDRTGAQEFTPLLYQVATAELAPSDVRFDLRRRFRHHHHVEVRVGEATGLEPATRRVTLADGEQLTADYVVVAAGSRPDFFHTDGADRYAYPLYSLSAAEQVRGQALRLLRDPPDEEPLRFVVVGGGPTGVETAGALADLLDDVAPHVPALAPGNRAGAEVVLVDHGNELLAAFSPESRRRAADRLRERGVQVRFGATVAQVRPDRVVLADGRGIPTRLVIWAGGEAAAPLVAAAGLPTGHGGRVDVAPDLSVPGFPGVYAVGDAANIPAGNTPAGNGGPDGSGSRGGNGHGHGRADTLPQLGSVAVQAGDQAARNLLADRAGTAREPFHYRDRGIMAMIDRQAAVAEVGPKRRDLHGRPAFAAWLAVHAELLHNVHSELATLTRWADEFYLRPHHRARSLLDPATMDAPRLPEYEPHPDHQEV